MELGRDRVVFSGSNLADNPQPADVGQFKPAYIITREASMLLKYVDRPMVTL